MYIVFRCNAIAQYRLQYSVNITFICTPKQKNLCASIYCDTRFIAVVWNQTCNISEVCLYFKEMLGTIMEIYSLFQGNYQMIISQLGH